MNDLGRLSDISSVIYPENGGELFFGFVSPLGTNVRPVIDAFAKAIRGRSYDIHEISLSKQIAAASGIDTSKVLLEHKRIEQLQDAGDDLRQRFGYATVGGLVCREVAEHRRHGQEASETQPKRAAYFFRTLKHPDEAALFRTIYGHGFFLVAVHSSYEDRLRKLRSSDIPDEVARQLLSRDEKDEFEHGQNTRETFELADFYIKDGGDVDAKADRFIRLIFNSLYDTPSRDEFGMYLAAGAAQRSSDLSRQVGASILDKHSDVLALGCNEVPKAGGGSYWPDDTVDVRDFQLGEDANDAEKRKRFDALYRSLPNETAGSKGQDENQNSRSEGGTAKKKITRDELDSALKRSELRDITEFQRVVHAEMDALLSCARRGVPVRKTSLYSTTFPCHNCARHIVAAGVKRVVYIEPYPKSEAYDLHNDSITCEAIPAPERSYPKTKKQVVFDAFEGVAPRRYTDFFSMRKITGFRIERKEKGRVRSHDLAALSTPRLQLSTLSYIDREGVAVNFVKEHVPRLAEKAEEQPKGGRI